MGSYEPNVTCLLRSKITNSHVIRSLLDQVPSNKTRETFATLPLVGNATVGLPVVYSGEWKFCI